MIWVVNLTNPRIYNRNKVSEQELKMIMENSSNRKEIKRKFALWARTSTLERTKEWYEKDNCRSQSEFIEKAILFYIGYLSSNENQEYLPEVITSTLKGIVKESENKTSRMLFKLAVELAVTMNVIASDSDIDKLTLEKLRGSCVKEVKSLNGSFSFNDALEWQRGE